LIERDRSMKQQKEYNIAGKKLVGFGLGKIL